MNQAPTEASVARERLAQEGWIGRRVEFFRHLPPPAAAVWLGDGAAPATSTAPSGLAGWSVQPVGDAPHTGVSAQWIDATGPQRHELWQDLPLPDATSDEAAPFAWAHRVLCRQGLRLRIDKDASSPAAQERVWVALQHRPGAAAEAPLAVVEVGAGVQAVLVETHLPPAAGIAASSIVQNLQLHLRLHEGASLVHLRVVEPAAGDHVAHHLHARLAKNASYRHVLIGEGSPYHLQRLVVDLDEEGASTTTGVITLTSGSKLDFQNRMRHKAPRTGSNVQALALARDAAHVVLNVHAVIMPGSDDAEAHQLVTGIPLRGTPRGILRPHMEILHDQLQATHGATWGALPEDALFYAQQRGIDADVARGLIVQGMAHELLTATLGDDALVNALDAHGPLAQAIARLMDNKAAAKEPVHG
ncbi:MAG: SufD family Fe-S cluster assembly protein [Brachymonas sp.]|nr:SufD family Fe-S cluster assembly protein [Brachymonas sp.]